MTIDWEKVGGIALVISGIYMMSNNLNYGGWLIIAGIWCIMD